MNVLPSKKRMYQEFDCSLDEENAPGMNQKYDSWVDIMICHLEQVM